MAAASEGVQGAGLRQVVQPRPALKPGRRGRAVQSVVRPGMCVGPARAALAGCSRVASSSVRPSTAYNVVRIGLGCLDRSYVSAAIAHQKLTLARLTPEIRLSDTGAQKTDSQPQGMRGSALQLDP